MSQNMHNEEGARPTNNGERFTSNLFKRRKLTSFGDVVLEVMKLNTLQQYFEPVMEPLIRRVVKEELQLAMRNKSDMQRNFDEEMQPADPRSLQLQFLNNVSKALFSESRIEAEEDTKLKLALIDASTREVVTHKPMFSAKVEIVVLDGDFDDDEGDNWTHEKFSSNLVRARKGKKALLTGDVILSLNEEVCLLSNITITDNSSWRRSGKFRLGARVLNSCNEIRVKEAKTRPFVVKD